MFDFRKSAKEGRGPPDLFLEWTFVCLGLPFDPLGSLGPPLKTMTSNIPPSCLKSYYNHFISRKNIKCQKGNWGGCRECWIDSVWKVRQGRPRSAKGFFIGSAKNPGCTPCFLFFFYFLFVWSNLIFLIFTEWIYWMTNRTSAMDWRNSASTIASWIGFSVSNSFILSSTAFMNRSWCARNLGFCTR